ncbi:MAG: SusD/RagB family nutrient-binding outer membrane lipoprotein [Prevotella sp.]|nr:SusD/RagB family nutrient-binding outer membrane lipoprotein [Prevotella sp.]MDY4629166.1 SusD/RagB family nutrient-binding outer membrane lipoprotein [Prevotella sp.]
MKKYIYTVLSAAVLGFSACSEDTMDTINKDNAHPSPDIVSAKFQLTDAIMSTGFTTVSGAYAWYLSSLTEQEFGSGNNQLMKAELRNSQEWAASTTFNNEWNGTYGNLMNIRQIIQKTIDGVSKGEKDIQGIAQVLEVINFGILTDLHGDIPYSEAVKGQEVLQPKLDSQKDVYAGLMTTIDAAISNLSEAAEAGMNNAGKQDIVFGGDPSAWLATAYAVKARYLLHQSAVDPSVVAKAKEAAEKAVELGFNGCEITEFNGVTCDNPWSAYVWSRYYTGSSATVANLMEPTGDPRLYLYTYNGKGAVFEPGDAEGAKLSACYDFPTWYDRGSQPIHLLSVSELYFILAECQLRSGEDATDAFKTAVAASVDEIYSWFDEDGGGEAFAESLGTPDLKAVFEQKYLAQCVDEQVETYNDIRRVEAMGEKYINLTNPNNVQSGINRWPYCLPYGNSSVISNPYVKEAYGDGTYIYTKKTWINGGK